MMYKWGWSGSERRRYTSNLLKTDILVYLFIFHLHLVFFQLILLPCMLAILRATYFLLFVLVFFAFIHFLTLLPLSFTYLYIQRRTADNLNNVLFLRKTCRVAWCFKIIMDDEKIEHRIWREMAVIYSNVLSNYLHEGTGENHEKPQLACRWGTQPRF
jgi:hypothetical protein